MISSSRSSEWTFPLLTFIGQFGLTWMILVTFRITGSIRIGVTSWAFVWIWCFAFACSHYPELIPAFQVALLFITLMTVLITRQAFHSFCVLCLVVITAFAGDYFEYEFQMEQSVGSSPEQFAAIRNKWLEGSFLIAILHVCAWALGLYVSIHIDMDKQRIAQMISRFAKRDSSTYMLISTISHEIRNPLSAMIGSIETLRAQLYNLVSPKQQLILTMAKQCGDVVRAITNNVLDSGIVWCDKMTIQTKPFDVRLLFTKVVALCKNLCTYGGIELAYRAAKELPGVIETDKSRLLQVLINLVSNALKHTTKGHVHISVNWEPDHSSVPANCSGPEAVQRPLRPGSYSEITINSKPAAQDQEENEQPEETAVWEGLLTEEDIVVSFSKSSNILKMSRSNQTFDCFNSNSRNIEEMLDGELYIQSDSFLYSHETEGVLVVEVIDSGNGISKEGLKRIFDPFVGGDQVSDEQSESSAYKSIGLGLSITRTIIREMGGSVDISSEVGQGTIVTLRLPVTVPPQKKKLKRQKTYGEADRLIEKIGEQKVMIVEDIHYNSITLKHLSHSLNCECAVVANGTDAVRFYETYHDQISAILMDICLPQLNGIDATKLIRYFEKKNEIRAVPIFIVTADLDNVSKKAAFAAGANEFFEKPLHRLVLAKALQLYSPSSMKIAFVDNDRFALDMYQSLVASEGYQSVCIANPTNLPQVLETESIDVIFANSLMQPQSGIQVVEQLRTSGVTLPIVIITGVVTEELSRKCQEHEVAHILRKPVTLEGLKNALRKTLRT